MKRVLPKPSANAPFGGKFLSLPDDLLKLVGAVALSYNGLEAALEKLCEIGLNLPIRANEVLSRIHGLDGKIELIKLAARQWDFSDEEIGLLGQALGTHGFQGLKSWRDAVVHARDVDAESGIGFVSERRGQAAEVLMTPKALRALFLRLELSLVEICQLQLLMMKKRVLKNGPEDDRHRERLERGISSALAQVRECRTEWQSLPPMPEFPDERPDLR